MAKDDRDEEETETEERDDSEEETESSEEDSVDETEGSEDDASDEDDDEYEDDDGEDEEEDDSAPDDAADSEDDVEDEDSDADEDDSDDEAAAASKRKTGRRRGKKGKGKRQSAGARLAAARAAKAARKAAKRGKEKQQEEQAPLDAVKESDLGQRAAQAGEWAQQNRTIVYAIAAAVILGLGGYIGWHYYSKGQAEAAGGLLAEALEISGAEIRGEDAPPPDEDDDTPSFESTQARAEAALEAFERVTSQHPNSQAAAWAYLGAGDALLELERYADARERFERAIAVAGTDDTVLWRALEGKGFTFEAEEQWGEAIEVYEELSRIDDGGFEPVAKYHLGRMYLAQGERDRATETFNTLVESLREANDDEEQQDFAFVLAQAEVRLRELDPSSAPSRPVLPAPGAGGLPGGGGAPGGPGDLSQEQIQELIRRFQQQQQGGGAPAPE